MLVQHGFSVAAAASITALGLSANIWRFIWAPMTDLTLSLDIWYLIGTGFSVLSLLGLCFVPLQTSAMAVLTVIAFISQVATTFVVNPVGGIMAKTVAEDKKGRAGGWYQAGNLGAMGAGGGAGIWLAIHLSYHASIFILSAAMLLSIFTLYFVPHVKSEKGNTLKAKMKTLACDMKDLFKSANGIFTTAIVLTPIGIGAAAYIWSSVGADWHASPDTVALVTGILSGIITAVGCVFGGWLADKAGRWWAFFGSGALMALVTLIMGVFPFTPFTYTLGVLAYAFAIGFAYAAFTAVALAAVGKGLASTKYALISSISNIPAVYMTAFDGWMHDKYSIKAMLLGETVLGLAFVAVSLIVLGRLGLHKAKTLAVIPEYPSININQIERNT